MYIFPIDLLSCCACKMHVVYGLGILPSAPRALPVSTKHNPLAFSTWSAFRGVLSIKVTAPSAHFYILVLLSFSDYLEAALKRELRIIVSIRISIMKDPI